MKKHVWITICLLALFLSVLAHADPNQMEALLQGALRLPKGISLQVAQPNGIKIGVIPENEQAVLPPGNYKVHYWEYKKIDAEGVMWKIHGYPTSPIQFEISDQPTALQINPEPIMATLTVGGQESYSFSQTLQGPAGETLYLYRDNVRIPPKVEITNQDKSFNATLSGTYG
ncbi:hypothetical protein ACFL6U_17315 [Planctomycetota bacterium]